MPKKYTIDDCKRILLENGSKVEILSTEYVNTKTKMKFKCECGDIFETTFSNVRVGCTCLKCGYAKTKSHLTLSFESVENRLRELNKNLILLEYTNKSTPIKVKCMIHNIEFYVLLSVIEKSKCGCKLCSREKKRTQKTRKLEDCTMDVNLKHNNNITFSVIGEYIGTKTNVHCICNKDGHEWNTTLSVLLRGHGCPYCAGNVKSTFDGFKKYIHDNNVNISIIETVGFEYKNSKTKVSVMCNECKNIFDTTIIKLKSGYGCPECSIKNRSGENHYMYNENLTEEHRDRYRLRADGMNQDKWRRMVFERDKHTCVLSGQVGGKLNAHHLNGYNWDIENQFNINNGVTLSKEIHNLFHFLYGKKDNTKQQFDEFSKRYRNGEFDALLE